jgi:hypothetical protein
VPKIPQRTERTTISDHESLRETTTPRPDAHEAAIRSPGASRRPVDLQRHLTCSSSSWTQSAAPAARHTRTR